MVKRHILRPAFPMVAVFLIALLSAGTALAAPSAQENSRGLFGTVIAVDASSITVQKDEETVVLKVDANVKVSIPGVTGPKVTDISVGSRVAVVTEQRPDGTYATLISVIASQPKQQHITITVVEVSGRIVIGETADGEQVVVELDFDPPPDLKGQIATFLGEQPESNRFKARALQKLQDVVDRLVKEIHAKKVDAQAEREQKAKEAKQQELEALKSRLENNLSEHLDRLAEVVSKAPPQSKEALENALEKIKQGYREAAAALEKAPQDAEDLIERRTIVGQVESLDTATGMIGVRTRGDALVNVKATADTQIRIDEAQGTLGDVHVGDTVQVLYNPKTGVAFRIRLLVVAEVEGLIKAVVPATTTTNAPVLTIELAGGATISLTVPASSGIEINHRPATIDSLTAGMQVAAKYNSRTMQLINLDAELEAEFKLTIQQVDLSGRTITGSTADGKSVTLKVTEKTRLEAKGNLFSIVGLQPGATITVRINPVTNEALRIVVEEPKEEKRPILERARGTIKAIDRDSKTLTLVLPDKSELTLTIGPATKISADGQEATSADIQPGMSVTVAYDPHSLAIVNSELHRAPTAKGTEQPSERPKVERLKVEGVIIGVDQTQGTLTIFTRKGEKLVLRVFPETNIALNERRLKALSELPAAAAVTVEYTTDGNVAISIQAKAKQTEETDKATAARTLVIPHVLEAKGTIIEVARASGVVVIKTAKGETLKLQVTADTQVVINVPDRELRRLGSLSDLASGAEVLVRYTSEGVVLGFAINEPGVGRDTAGATLKAKGVIKGIGGSGGGGSVIIATEEGAALTVRVNANTQIVINEAGLRQTPKRDFGDLAVGASVEVEYTADGVAIRLVVNEPGVGRDTAGATLKAKGIIKGVGGTGGGGSVIIATEEGAALTVRVNANTQIVINEPGLRQTPKRDFGDLAVGASVEVEYTADGVAIRLVVNEPGLPGERATPTPTKQPAQSTGRLTPTPTKQSGQVVEKPTPTPTKQAAQVIERATPTPTKQAATLKAKGVVKGIGSTGGGASITIATEGGAALTLTVNASTQIAINEEGVQRRGASIADLKVGATVEVEYTSDGVAKSIIQNIRA